MKNHDVKSRLVELKRSVKNSGLLLGTMFGKHITILARIERKMVIGKVS